VCGRRRRGARAPVARARRHASRRLGRGWERRAARHCRGGGGFAPRSPPPGAGGARRPRRVVDARRRRGRGRPPPAPPRPRRRRVSPFGQVLGRVAAHLGGTDGTVAAGEAAAAAPVVGLSHGRAVSRRRRRRAVGGGRRGGRRGYCRAAPGGRGALRCSVAQRQWGGHRCVAWPRAAVGALIAAVAVARCSGQLQAWPKSHVIVARSTKRTIRPRSPVAPTFWRWRSLESFIELGNAPCSFHMTFA